MSRARVLRGTLLVDPPKESGKVPKSAAVQESKAAAERALGNIPMRTTVTLWRLERATGNEAWLATIDADAFTLEYVAEQYGGGDYRMVVRGPTGHGRLKGYEGGDKFTIDKAIPAKAPQQQGATPAAPGAVALPTAAGGLAASLEQMQGMMVFALMRQMLEMSSMQAKAVREFSEPRRDPIAEALAAKMAADPLELAIKLQTLATKSGGGLSDVDALLGAFAKLQALQGAPQQVVIEKSEDAGWLRLVELLAPPIIEASRREDRRALAPGRDPRDVTPPAAPSPSANGSTPEPAAASVSQAPATDKTPNPLTPLRPIMADLLRAARRGVDPALACDWVVQSATDEQQTLLRQVLDDPAILSQLATAWPELTAHVVWLGKVRGELLASFAGDVAAAGDGEPGGSDGAGE